MKNKIVLHRELEGAVFNCKTALQRAQEALYQLNALADYPTPSTLADVTTKSLVAFVEQRIKAVMATSLYTTLEKEKITNNWIEWKVKAMPYVGAVESFVNDWQDVFPVLDTSDMTILTSDITESLTHRYIVEVPLQAHAHLALIEDVKKSIRALRQWEKEQDLKKIPLKELVNTSEDNLLQSWASGFIKVNDADDEGAKRWREAVYNATF
jgi:hypothetical protein